MKNPLDLLFQTKKSSETPSSDASSKKNETIKT